MSLFQYNGVILPYPLTTQFSQDAVYDDSGTDRIYTKFTIGIQCIVNSSYLNELAPNLFLPNSNTPATKNPADIMAAIRSKLLQQRKTLSMQFNGVELIPQPSIVGKNRGKVDAKNGPQPKSCSILPITNTTFLLSYSIEANYWENNKIVVEPDDDDPIVQGQEGASVLYNRWSETMEIDNCNYTTRTREGKYIIRSDNTMGFIADDLRNKMAVAGVPPGFLRKSSRYTVSPDGLGISYSLVDQEIFKKPPAPAYEATGYYSESTPRGGAIRYGEAHVQLKGSKSTPQEELIEKAVLTAKAKLESRGNEIAPGQGFQILEAASVRIGLYENTVECTIRGMIARDNEQFGAVGNAILAAAGGIKPSNPINAFVGMTTETPYSDKDYRPDYPPAGTAGRLLQAAAYYDPSLKNVIVNVKGDACTSQLTAGKEVGQVGRHRE